MIRLCLLMLEIVKVEKKDRRWWFVLRYKVGGLRVIEGNGLVVVFMRLIKLR